LPLYAPDKRVVGIDLSRDMLKFARQRVIADRLATVEAVLEMDAEATSFADAEFDMAVAMFVASVVPHPRRLMAELRRVVRPGGHILLVNHFAAERGPRWWVERALAPASRALGWHPDFRLAALLGPDELAAATVRPMHPCGLFTLVQLRA
jgi:phosphatidylethanolamine/phosphatidyl-N-methylethanolamine N-methyltransferase